jgi:hypothetical protein
MGKQQQAELSLAFSFDSVATTPLIKELQCVSIGEYHSKRSKETQARKAFIGRTGKYSNHYNNVTLCSTGTRRMSKLTVLFIMQDFSVQ